MSTWFHGSATDSLTHGLAPQRLYASESRELAATDEFAGSGGYVFEIELVDTADIFDPDVVASAAEFKTMRKFLASLPSDKYRAAVTHAASTFFEVAIGGEPPKSGILSIPMNEELSEECEDDWERVADSIREGEFVGQTRDFWTLFSHVLGSVVSEGGYWSYADLELGLAMDDAVELAGFDGHYETEDERSVRNIAIYRPDKTARVVGYTTTRGK